MLKWTVECDSQPDYDGGLRQGFTVTDGEKSFETRSEEHADWLCGVLNELEYQRLRRDTVKPS